jgi:hypothetical protein
MREKEMKRIAFFGAVAVLAAIFYCHISYAELTSKDLPNREGIKVGIGNIVVHSAFKVQEQFDSNIFLKDSDIRSDGITSLHPSVGVEIPFSDNMLSADYDVDINLFGHYTDQDHTDQRARGLLEINLTDYKITVDNVYRRFTDRASSETSTRVKRQTNDFKAGVSAEFELLGFDVNYKNTVEDYLITDLVWGPLTYEDKSTMTNIVGAVVSYRFLPKTLILLESDLGFVKYYNSSIPPDSYYTETVLGLKGEWFKKSNVNLKAGFRYHSYDHSDILKSKDFIGPVIRGGFDYFPTEVDTIGVRLERTIYESTYSTMNYYNVNLVKVEYTHNFSDKFSANAFGSYQLNLYPGESIEDGVTAKRHDNLFGGGCGLRYDIQKWVSLEAKYEYRQRISKFETFDYIDNLATIAGTIGF